MKAYFLLFLLLLLGGKLPLQGQATASLRVMAYNVENLFDTEDDPRHRDEDFTPTGAYRWTKARYALKLQHIAEVISAVGEETFPALVGLVEVENGQVLEDLLRYTTLGEQAGYRYLVTDGEDRRGINVALLYAPDAFRLLAREEIPIHFPFDSTRHTRPLLHATGVVPSGDTLHVVVCHLPSRRGGAVRSAPYRRYAAELLCARVQQLLAGSGAHTHGLLLGDFNGEAEEPFLSEGLGVRLYPLAAGEIAEREAVYALLHHRLPPGAFGSYCYQGIWTQLDQLLVSGSLLRPAGTLRYEEGSAEVVRRAFYLTEEGAPWRSYGGRFYRGGYSDHLPVRLTLRYQLCR